MVFIRWEKLLVDWIDSLGLLVVGTSIGSVNFEKFISKLNEEKFLNSKSIEDLLNENVALSSPLNADPKLLASFILYFSCKNWSSWKMMKACFTLNKLQQEAIVKFVESLENIGDRKLDVESLNHAIEVATKPAQISTPKGTLNFMSPGAIIVTPSPTQTPKMIFITKQKQELKIVKKELFQERCHSEDMESLLHDSEEIRNVYEKEKQKSNHEIQKLRSKVQQMESSSADKSPKTSEKNLVIREKDLMKLKKLEIRLNDINEQIEETNKFNVKEFSFLKDDMRNVRKELSNINFRLNSNEESLRVELDNKDNAIKRVFENIANLQNFQEETQVQHQKDPNNTSCFSITDNGENLGFVVELQLQEQKKENLKLKEMLAFQNEEIAKLNNNQVQNGSSENKEVLQEFKSQTRRIQELEVSTENLLIALLRQEKLQLQGALKNVQFMDIIQQLKTKLRETRSHNRLLTMESDSLKQHLTEHKQKLSHHERDYKNERDTMKRTIKKLSDEIEEVVLMNSYLEIDITSLNLKLTADRNNFSKKKALLVKNFKSLETELKQCELKNDEQAIIILNLREDLMAIKENEMLFNETQQQNQSNFNAVSSPDLNQRAFFDDSNKLQKLKETINGLKSDWEDINFLRGQLDVSQNCLIDLSCSIESIKSFNIQAKKKSLF